VQLQRAILGNISEWLHCSPSRAHCAIALCRLQKLDVRCPSSSAVPFCSATPPGSDCGEPFRGMRGRSPVRGRGRAEKGGEFPVLHLA